MAGLNHQNGAEVAPRRINRVPSNRFGVRGLLSRSASVMKKPFVVEVRARVEVGASPRFAFFDICEICESQFGICEMVGRPGGSANFHPDPNLNHEGLFHHRG